jgi:hypothetical protein
LVRVQAAENSAKPVIASLKSNSTWVSPFIDSMGWPRLEFRAPFWPSWVPPIMLVPNT